MIKMKRVKGICACGGIRLHGQLAVLDKKRTTDATSTTTRFRETGLFEDISIGLIEGEGVDHFENQSPGLDHWGKRYNTYACLFARFTFSFFSRRSSDLSITGCSSPLDSESDEPLLFDEASSSSCLAIVRFAFKSAPKESDSKSL